MKQTMLFIMLPALLVMLLTSHAVPAASAGSTGLASAAAPAADCDPAIAFDFVPPIGSFEDLTGHVACVEPNDYAVAVYIYAHGWYTKPYWGTPWTTIQPDGTWTTDITTGGSDEQAVRIAAFLVDKDSLPILMKGEASLPAELYDNAAANVSIRRGSPRTIHFSGYTWEVRNSPTLSGPGPNFFSDDPENVWVDDDGYLHLKITRRGQDWHCAEVINTSTAMYGAYGFELASPVDGLDKNAVFGFFSWDTSAPEYNYREIDIEFSRWGDENNENAQYVIQPWDAAGNMHRFSFDQAGPNSRHRFIWLPDSVRFDSWDSSGAQSETWTYTNSAGIPPEGGNIHINLWLTEGKAPSDGETVEVVIKSVEKLYRIFLPYVR